MDRGGAGVEVGCAEVDRAPIAVWLLTSASMYTYIQSLKAVATVSALTRSRAGCGLSSVERTQVATG